jgi:hypothetical protein
MKIDTQGQIFVPFKDKLYLVGQHGEKEPGEWAVLPNDGRVLAKYDDPPLPLNQLKRLRAIDRVIASIESTDRYIQRREELRKEGKAANATAAKEALAVSKEARTNLTAQFGIRAVLLSNEEFDNLPDEAKLLYCQGQYARYWHQNLLRGTPGQWRVVRNELTAHQMLWYESNPNP